ncbi:MAG: peptidoglycan recognition family protein [Ilumatobacteraceae bacterium]
MCDACKQLLNRRTLLRSAVIGGAAMATAGLWAPDADAVGTGAVDEWTLEHLAMGEDWPAASSDGPQGRALARQGRVVARPNATRATAVTAASPDRGPGRWAEHGSAPNSGGLAAPPIAPRAAWGADESIRLDNRAYAPVRKLIVHHSASENKPNNPADVVRFVQRDHTKNRGFSDTGYNYLIDHKGAIYEGRAARRYGGSETISNEDNKGWGVVGAHAKRNNAGSCGICLIGNFDTGSPTDAAVTSLVWLLAYKASRYRIDAAGADDYIDLYGAHRVYPNISGHRDVGRTACPGERLFALLPAIRDEVERRAGHWDPVTVDVPRVLRWEIGALRAPSGSTPATTPASGASPGPGSGSGSGSGSASGAADPVDPGGGTTLIGVRVVSSTGQIYSAGSGRAHGNPSANGPIEIVALANATSGDGYWALAGNGSVMPFGGVATHGDAVGKGVAVDLAVNVAATGYWILMADGGIYPFGAARYASSPKRAGRAGPARRIAPRPQGDGYWILMADGTVPAFGSAPVLGTPAGLGNAVDIVATPTGNGYWILTDAGVVAPFGDAVDKGDLKRSMIRWSKRATHLLATPSGAGYVIVNSEGSMLAFGDAPLYASFGGSGIRATGVAPVFD